MVWRFCLSHRNVTEPKATDGDSLPVYIHDIGCIWNQGDIMAQSRLMDELVTVTPNWWWNIKWWGAGGGPELS